MKIVVLSDIHIAKIWDTIDELVPKKEKFLNPNHYFRKLVGRLSSLDTLVINGDLVDYYGGSYFFRKRKSNWEIFFGILKKFKGASLLNLGNHDYRKSAYNFNIYGLEHVNLSSMVRKAYAKKIGYNQFRFLKEFDSVRVDLEKFQPIPRQFSSLPKKKILGCQKILLLNTGPDAFTRSSNLLRISDFPLMFSETPALAGLSQEEIVFLEKELFRKDAYEILIFLHGAPFFAKNKIENLTLSDKSEKKYFQWLKNNKLAFGIFFQNNWRFMQAILSSEKNIVVTTSHTHIARQYVVDKKTKVLREVSLKKINLLRENSRYIKFISTLPFGAIEEPRKIGYLTISKKNIQYKVMKDF